MANKETTWDTSTNRGSEVGVGMGMMPADPERMTEREWIARHRASYTVSHDWMQANLRRQWETNMRSFNNRHPNGSKYFSDNYKQRSKLFRPKTRSALRKAEAQAARAYFASEDLVELKPRDPDNPMQQANAELMKHLLNLRLDANPIQWFMTLLGAYQNTKTLGICVSKQFWDFQQETRLRYAQEVDELGNPMVDEAGQMVIKPYTEIGEVLKDEPAIRLCAPENTLCDPGADWLDPVESSPYFIEMIPMYVGDVKHRMKVQDLKTGAPKWIERSDSEIMSARTQNYNATRQAREDYREDSKDNRRNALYDHDIIWVHEACQRMNGTDWHYYTLGTEFMLSEPQPLEKSYFHNKRPWVMGVSIIEAHKMFPASVTQLAQDLQREANEIANQRIDNVRFAMNPRVFVRQGGAVDLAALNRSVPGGPVTMANPGGQNPDVIVDRPPEVTASAYAEQDRVNVDFDEIAGSFSTSSVQTNRQMNETVGGMELLNQGAAEINDLDLTVFTLTYVQPVLTDLVKLEQAYETDEALLASAGKKARIFQRFGIDEITDELLQGGFTLRVSVGIGAPNPNTKFIKFSSLMKGIMELYGDDAGTELNRAEIAKEAFGIMGYRDGDRFLINSDVEDPAIKQLQQMIEKLQGMLDETQREGELEMAKEHMKQKGALAKQSMADRTRVLQELIRMAGDRQAAAEAQAGNRAGQMFEAAQSTQARREDQTHQMRSQQQVHQLGRSAAREDQQMQSTNEAAAQ